MSGEAFAERTSALHMPVGLYVIAAGTGKIIKNIAVAYGAAYGIEWLTRVFGG